MPEIRLTRNKVALVDDVDYERISKFRWYADRGPSGNWYARAWEPGMKPRKRLHMHRLVMLAPRQLDVDHVNNDGLDNRRSNLRTCTRKENTRNQRAKGGNRYKGVNYVSRLGKWRAQISTEKGTKKYLGVFEYLEDAARAYDIAARALFGNFAKINFPGEM